MVGAEPAQPLEPVARPSTLKPVNTADVLLVAWIGLLAAQGFYRGLAAQLVSLAGIALGGFAGSWVAPNLLEGGERSPWVPMASLTGAFVGALTVGFAAGSLADRAQRFLAARSPLRVLDSAGGVAGGVVLALALAWLAAVVFLHQPRLGLREAVQRSAIMPALVRAVPPETVLRALNRFDPLPLLPAATGRLPPPDVSVLRSAGARVAAASVVKIEGTSCGLGVQGSGWVVRRELVATNAHVIAGQQDTRVLAPNGQSLHGRVVHLDGANDVALVRVPGLAAAPLGIDRDESFPEPVVLLGYPGDGALTGTAATAGAPRTVLAPDAYGRRIRPRLVVPLRGRVRRGGSGGPVVDRRGRVLAMIFGGQRRGGGGFGVPVELVLRGLRGTLRPVSSGPCIG